MAKTLKKIFQEHDGKVTDKWSLYLEEWDRLFVHYRNQQIDLLEIGIQNGGSLEIWAKYFKNAKNIIGSDIDTRCSALQFADDRINIVIGDANTNEIESKITKIASAYDLIIDDGSHKSSDVIGSFMRYFPYLKIGGIYLVEDIHASYWKDFEGGLHNPLTTMGFFKRITDIVNFEHWRNKKTRASMINRYENSLSIGLNDTALSEIHSVEFLNSLCIITKAHAESNVLGKRIVVGTQEQITEQTVELNNTLMEHGIFAIEDDSNLDQFNLIDDIRLLSNLSIQLSEREKLLESMKEEINIRDQTILRLGGQLKAQDKLIQKIIKESAERDQTIQSINRQLTEYLQEIVSLVTSKSWRYTRPIRKIYKILRGNSNG